MPCVRQSSKKYTNRPGKRNTTKVKKTKKKKKTTSVKKSSTKKNKKRKGGGSCYIFESKPSSHPKKLYTSVTFGISRFGKFSKTIRFNTKKSEKEIVTKVCQFLSKKMTKKYFDKVKKDSFAINFKVGDKRIKALGDRIFFEKVQKKGTNGIIITGS